MATTEAAANQHDLGAAGEDHAHGNADNEEESPRSEHPQSDEANSAGEGDDSGEGRLSSTYKAYSPDKFEASGDFDDDTDALLQANVRSSSRGAQRISGAAAVDAALEEHWAIVMKRLAPQGYNRSPKWQQSIIERVIQTMSAREKDEHKGSPADAALDSPPLGKKAKEDRATIDLAALGLNPEAVAAIQQEEERVKRAIEQMPSTNLASRSSMLVTSADNMSRTSQEKLSGDDELAQRHNQVHYYNRAIQMEQLQQQDLESDAKQLSDELARATKNAKGGHVHTAKHLSKVAKQMAVMQNRCEAVAIKASTLNAENAATRLEIDNMRAAKVAHNARLEKLRQKAAKMDEDIAFLTQSAHAALDQREKVKAKFLAAQRDMQQEREQKLELIKELSERAQQLEAEWGEREVELAASEEAQRRKNYVAAKKRRAELEMAETKFGFLANQVRGWDSEFVRLQEFTGMDAKFEPGQQGIVDEITNRFYEKERANVSLLRFLHEQEAEIANLSDQRRSLTTRREDLAEQLDSKMQDFEGKAIDEIEAAIVADNERCAKAEELLSGACRYVRRIGKSLWRSSEAHQLVKGDCTISSLEQWLRTVDARITQIRQASSALVLRATAPPSPVLAEWCAARPKRPHLPVPEIHAALAAQAEQRRMKNQDIDDDDDDEAERLREKESKITPFNKPKVDRERERKQIIEWARKRAVVKISPDCTASSPTNQSKVHTKKQLGSSAAMAGSAAAALRNSASAPTLAVPLKLPSPYTNGENASRAVPARRATPEYAKSIRTAAMVEPESDLAAENMPGAGMPKRQTSSGGGARTMPTNGRARDARGAHSKSMPKHSPSMPQLHSPSGRSKSPYGAPGPANLASAPAPKDLGTMIYLLGPNSNSMDARRLGTNSSR